MRRIRWWRPTLLVALLATLQTAVAPRSGGASRPDLLLVLVLYFALRARQDVALIVAWGAGLGKDLFSVGPLGAHALLFLGVAAGILAARHYLFLDRLGGQVLLAFGAHLACDLAYWLLLTLWHPQNAGLYAVTRVLLGATYTAILTPLAFWLLGCAGRWLSVTPRPGFGPA